MKLTITTLLIFLAAVSCKKDIYSGITFNVPVFPDSVEVKTTLLNDTIYTKYIADIGIYKDHLILFTPGEDYMFQLYDKKTGAKIKDFGELGRGPQQILKIDGISINSQCGTLTAFHQATREIYCFYLDSVIQNRSHFMDKINIIHYEDMTFSSALGCEHGFLLCGGKCEVYPGGARLTLFAKDGQIMDAYDEYPFSSNPQDSIHAGEDWRYLLTANEPAEPNPYPDLYPWDVVGALVISAGAVAAAIVIYCRRRKKYLAEHPREEKR